MNLHLYRIGDAVPVLTIENVRSYTADSVTTETGEVYSALAEDCELSSKADCSETLRADWREAHIDEKTRLDELEALLALLLFGGEDE